MRHEHGTITLKTSGPGLTEFTAEAAGWLKETGAKDGVLTLFIAHTSASLLIQENADPDVLKDMQDFFDGLVKKDIKLYRHTAEGPDDMPAHIRSALTQVSLSVPIRDGKLALGTWQGLYLFEHRDHGFSRRIALAYLGA